MINRIRKNAEPASPAEGGVRAVQSERRRQEILKASIEVLAQGQADFSLRKVAVAAGVRLNTVQHHFGDLESLIYATVESKAEEYLARFRQLAAGQYGSPADELMVFLDDSWMWIRDAGTRAFVLELWAMGLHRPSIGELLRRFYAEYRAAVAAIVRKVNPSLTKAEANTMAALVCSMAEGAVVMAHWSGLDMPSLSLLGVRLKAACLALVGTSAANQAKPKRRTTQPAEI